MPGCGYRYTFTSTSTCRACGETAAHVTLPLGEVQVVVLLFFAEGCKNVLPLSEGVCSWMVCGWMGVGGGGGEGGLPNALNPNLEQR